MSRGMHPNIVKAQITVFRVQIFAIDFQYTSRSEVGFFAPSE